MCVGMTDHRTDSAVGAIRPGCGPGCAGRRSIASPCADGGCGRMSPASRFLAAAAATTPTARTNRQEAGADCRRPRRWSAAWRWCWGSSFWSFGRFAGRRPTRMGTLPAEVFEVLGRAPLANRQQAMMLRCGNKLLLVSAGVAGTETADRNHRSRRGRSPGGLCRQGRSAAPRRPSARCFGRRRTAMREALGQWSEMREGGNRGVAAD